MNFRKGNFGGHKKTFLCTFCNQTGHVIDRCHQKHGYPPNFKFKTEPESVDLVCGNTPMAGGSSIHKSDENVSSGDGQPLIGLPMLSLVLAVML